MDRLENCDDLAEYVMLPEPQHSDPLRHYELSATYIIPSRRIGIMLPAIKLNGQLSVVAVEIENVWLDGC